MKKYIVILTVVVLVLIYIGLAFDWGRREMIIESEKKEDLIVVNRPTALARIKSPIVVSGKARGFWFFEGSFPVVVEDSDGNVVGQGIAQADGEWMTEDFVDFEGKVEFEISTSTTYGKIVFKKDNPSGLPEHDDSFDLPVKF